MVDETRYDDRETALILRMAAELDHRPTGTGVGGRRPTGQSLGDIEQIAEEAGIRPESVRRAAAALAAELQPGGSSLMGGPTTFRFERVVPGRLKAADLLEIVQSIGWDTGKSGKVTELAEGAEWEHKTDEGPLLRVELTARGDETRVRLLGRYEDPAGWVAILGGVSAVGAAIATSVVLDGSAALFFGSLAGCTAAAYWGVRRMWRGISARVDSRLSSLMESVTERARALAEARPAGAPVPAALRGETDAPPVSSGEREPAASRERGAPGAG